jgi:hypothetical protein
MPEFKSSGVQSEVGHNKICRLSIINCHFWGPNWWSSDLKQRSGTSPAPNCAEALVMSLLTENRELARIFSASIKTAQAKGLQRPNDK